MTRLVKNVMAHFPNINRFPVYAVVCLQMLYYHAVLVRRALTAGGLDPETPANGGRDRIGGVVKRE